jgi:hypothetical protein
VLCERRVYAIKTRRHHISCGNQCQPALVFHSQATPQPLVSLCQHYEIIPKIPTLTYTRHPLCDMHHTILTTISLYSLFKRCCVNRVRPKGFHLRSSSPAHTVYPERS